MIASLSMYSRPKIEGALFNFWDLIRNNLHESGINSPNMLCQQRDPFTVWTDPALVLSQTCGMPYRNFLHGNVKLIGTPIYDLQDCPDGYYNSAFVIRKNDPRNTLKLFKNARFAFNEENSQSGFAAPLNHAANLGFTFNNRVQSHSHANSAAMVATGQADIAALDAISWKLVQEHDEAAAHLMVLEHTTPPTPALPFITSLSNDAELLFAAIKTAIDDLPTAEKRSLHLKGIVKIPAQEYLNIPNPRLRAV